MPSNKDVLITLKDNQMPNAKEETSVRLQIPIHREVATELEKLADGFDRPISWMARELLTTGVECEEGLLAWLTFRIIGKGAGSKREKLQCKLLPDCNDGDIVRIQVNVPGPLAERIEAQARNHFRAVSNMASLLLVRALDDEAWMINFIQSKYSAPLRALIPPGRKPKKTKTRKAA